MPTFSERLQHAWNAFTNRDPPSRAYLSGPGSYRNPDRVVLHYGATKSIVSSVYNRIAVDVAATTIQHVRVNNNGQRSDAINSGLNYCLNTEANIDQTGRAFIQDAVMSMFDEGVIAIVPVDITMDPELTGSYKIQTMRIGKVREWYPKHVKVDLYNDRTGRHEEIFLPKEQVAIVQNPLYSVMNEDNSILQRLIRKLALLDAVDEQQGAGKLDMIIQLPYVIKTPARKEQAEMRRQEIETQLSSSKYGIAYTDGTERITQLNRPVESTLNSQVEYLTRMLYSQLGLTEAIFNGTANESEQLNYYNSTVEPILAALCNEMERKFLTKTARSQNQAIRYYREPFRLVPVQQLAEIADKFTRNEIMTPNEIRAIVGYAPVDDPNADELRNRNITQSKNESGGLLFDSNGGANDDLGGFIQNENED